MLELPDLNAPPGLDMLGVEPMGPPKPTMQMGPPKPTEESKSFGDVMKMGGEETNAQDDEMKEKMKTLGAFMEMAGASGGGLAGAGAGVMNILAAKGEDWASIGNKLKGMF